MTTTDLVADLFHGASFLSALFLLAYAVGRGLERGRRDA